MTHEYATALQPGGQSKTSSQANKQINQWIRRGDVLVTRVPALPSKLLQPYCSFALDLFIPRFIVESETVFLLSSPS